MLTSLQLATLQKALEDENNILKVYTNLTELVRLRKFAVQQSSALESETKVSVTLCWSSSLIDLLLQEAVLEEFKGMDDIFKALEEIMWTRLADCVNLGKARCAARRESEFLHRPTQPFS